MPAALDEGVIFMHKLILFYTYFSCVLCIKFSQNMYEISGCHRIENERGPLFARWLFVSGKEMNDRFHLLKSSYILLRIYSKLNRHEKICFFTSR